MWLYDFCFYPSLFFLSKTRFNKRLILFLFSGVQMISLHVKCGCCAISLGDFGIYPFLIYLSKTRPYRRLILFLCSGHYMRSQHLKGGCCCTSLKILVFILL